MPTDRPGNSVKRVLLTMPAPDRLPFLAHAEQGYRQRGDMTMLRAIKDFRKMLEADPSLIKAPQTA